MCTEPSTTWHSKAHQTMEQGLSISLCWEGAIWQSPVKQKNGLMVCS